MLVNAYISGTGGYVPPGVVRNQDLVEAYGVETSHEWIVQRTGIEERRFSDGQTTSDLAVPAAKMARGRKSSSDRFRYDLVLDPES